MTFTIPDVGEQGRRAIGRATVVGLAALAAALATPSASASHSGAKLYRQHCAACHGATGHGGVGVPLALPDFLATVEDDYLRKTIRLGRPGRVMPAFANLTDAEVDSIVHHIRAWQTRPLRVDKVRVRPGDPARGATLYANSCASCHGADGEGGHGTGVTFSRPRDLPILPPALNNAGFLAAASDAMIKASLVYGREGTPMASYLEQGFSEQDIDDVVAYVRSFAARGAAPGATVLETESAVIVRESPDDVARTVERLRNALSAVNMRIIRSVPFEQGIVDKGKENPKRMIVDACDFNFLNKALKVDPRVGLFLPCRFTVVEHEGKVLVMAINPKRLSAIYNNAELNELCTQMHQIYVNVIEEATF